MLGCLHFLRISISDLIASKSSRSVISLIATTAFVRFCRPLYTEPCALETVSKGTMGTRQSERPNADRRRLIDSHPSPSFSDTSKMSLPVHSKSWFTCTTCWTFIGPLICLCACSPRGEVVFSFSLSLSLSFLSSFSGFGFGIRIVGGSSA